MFMLLVTLSFLLVFCMLCIFVVAFCYFAAFHVLVGVVFLVSSFSRVTVHHVLLPYSCLHARLLIIAALFTCMC
jgi:hypothetical protein